MNKKNVWTIRRRLTYFANALIPIYLIMCYFNPELLQISAGLFGFSGAVNLYYFGGVTVDDNWRKKNVENTTSDN